MVYFMELNVSDLETSLSNNVFIHAIPEKEKADVICWDIDKRDMEENENFSGIRLDTCSNRTSVMGKRNTRHIVLLKALKQHYERHM